ncbi:hypothetical protein HMPREF1577_00221 [Gardnerella pickettii JCP8017A]|uniref:Uncharacterized protein n=1 Tax=Gardnerella pickettii JCP8017A TaxID=1261062 RepID=T2PM39_9BIFI|nr:hypothetical protein HMPREF1577_00221 [Gardnerella pickettii JCP8017A]EPI62108.1 hypothetical protein HMPREF1578_00327 [Gardnerella pickettii JCP8017B]
MENAVKKVNKMFIKPLKMWISEKIAPNVDNSTFFAHNYP